MPTPGMWDGELDIQNLGAGGYFFVENPGVFGGLFTGMMFCSKEKCRLAVSVLTSYEGTHHTAK